MDVKVSRLTSTDAGELITLQRAAYLSEAQIYGDLFMPPLVEPLEEAEAFLSDAKRLSLGLRLSEGRLIAAGRITWQGRNEAYISRLCVAPDQQGQGLGSRMLAELEQFVKEHASRLVLATGEWSESNLRLYRARGYSEFERIMLPAGYHEVHLAKPGSGM